MNSLWKPDLRVRSLLEIDVAALKERNIQGMIFDLDNTILSWGSDAVSSEIAIWLRDLQRYDMQACLVSNNFAGRVGKIANHFCIPYVARAYKPFQYGFYKALTELDLPAERVAVIGDQIFTDIWGGNRMRMYTILVPPLSEREFITTKWVRCIEQWLMKRYQ